MVNGGRDGGGEGWKKKKNRAGYVQPFQEL
jgi:hypothetical protein